MNEKTLTIFDTGIDIGDVGAAGSVSFADGTYSVAGSGYNMWFGTDAFHFVWTRVDGDVSLAADISFAGAGADPHRKGCLIVRQSLDPDSVYAGIAVHGDGLTSLQYRDERGADTHEVQSNVTGPSRVAIERRGDYVSASVDDRPSGGSVRLEISEPFYIGLAVCSHIRGVAETARFSDVVLSGIERGDTLISTLETIELASTDRRTVQVFEGHIEAPNWTSDDRLVYNSGGLLYSIPSAGGASIRIDSGFATACNNDHGLSPDGTLIAISDQSQGDGGSVIYTVPIGGGAPVRITDRSPSYWHGWSPDGATLAFCGERDGAFGIFTIPATGGEETRLTTAVHLDDGPEYSPDGEWIYFNSDRTGLMQLYRMHTDGSGVERVTDDDRGNWFPHVSPDGRWLVFVSYEAEVDGHPADKDVRLQLLELGTGSVSTIAKLFGGQGTINVPSWSPDSTRVAFVSYSYI